MRENQAFSDEFEVKMQKVGVLLTDLIVDATDRQDKEQLVAIMMCLSGDLSHVTEMILKIGGINTIKPDDPNFLDKR